MQGVGGHGPPSERTCPQAAGKGTCPGNVAAHPIPPNLPFHVVQIRFSSVQLIDELFQRSNVFRQAVTDDFAQFLHHAIGVQGHPLPPPDHAAEKLRELGLRCLRAWSTQFGVAYPQLAVAYEYVKSDTQLLASIASVQRREQEEARLKVRARVNIFYQYNNLQKKK